MTPGPASNHGEALSATAIAGGSRDTVNTNAEKSNANNSNINNAITASHSNSGSTISATGATPTPANANNNINSIAYNPNSSSRHNGSLSSLGEASGVAILLGNHAKFGLAERCCYHFDLIDTLTSLPLGRVQQARASRRGRDRGMSISSQEGGDVSSNAGSSSGGTAGGTTTGGTATTTAQGTDSKDAAGLSSATSSNAKANAKPSSKSNNNDTTTTAAKYNHCSCGVVSLLECVAGGGAQQPPVDRTAKRALRSKHREFNTRAQLAWGRRGNKTTGGLKRRNKLGGSGGGGSGGGGSGGGTGAIGGSAGGSAMPTTRRCHQPRHLPLPLNPNTRVSFAYELTSIAILVDASPGLTSTFGMPLCDFGGFGEDERNIPMEDACCVPLDRLGAMLKKYLLGLVQSIDVPPVAVSGLGVAFGRWTPNLAITVVAVYPPTSKGDRASAGLLVRDFRVTDEGSAIELSGKIERWALGEVEGAIAERLCGERDFLGDGVAGRRDDNNNNNSNHGVQYTPLKMMSPLASHPLPSRQTHGSTRTNRSGKVTFMKDVLSVGDAALSTLPPEGRPVLVVATDCRNVHCGGAFDALSETARSDVPITVLDLSSSSNNSARQDGPAPDVVGKQQAQHSSSQHGSSHSSSYGKESIGRMEYSPFPLSISDDSQSLRDACHLSGGLFLQSKLLDLYTSTAVGSPNPNPSSYPSTLMHQIGGLDYHFSFKKRSIKPNALQWYTLFTLSPFTPGGSLGSLRPGGSLSLSSTLRGGVPNPINNSAQQLASSSFMTGTLASSSFAPANYSRSISSGGSSVGSTAVKQLSGKSSAAELLQPGSLGLASSSNLYEGRARSQGASLDVSTPQERIVFAKYNIQPIRIKSLLMTRVLEGYHAKRYGHNTQDHDKVSVHLVLRLADCGVVLHYEASFVSSPYHMPMVGQAHIKLELSGDDADFIQLVKKMFVSSNHGGVGVPIESSVMHHQGRRVSASSKAAADRICKLLRWTRKEDYLESYLCLPGWGDVNHFSAGSSFLGRIQSLSQLQRYRHFRSEVFEIVTLGPNFYEKSESLFSDLMEQNKGEDEMYSVLSSWSTAVISDREMYLKVIVPGQDDDLAYYCIVRIVQSPTLSRLFTITVDFHGEINAEQRLALLFTLKDNFRRSSDIIVLEKCISRNVAIRPASPSFPWTPCWNEYFLHHKTWDLLQEGGVLPLITKRRNEIGGFIILMQDDSRAIFAKFVKSQEEERFPSLSHSVVIYQVLSRTDGIFVDIHMEASRSTFYPFHGTHSSTTFSGIYERVKRRDKDCARNVRSRTNLLAALDHNINRPDTLNFHPKEVNQAEDAMRLIKLSACTKRKLRFFNDQGSGSANELLCSLTTDYITSDSFHTQAAKLTIDQNISILGYSGSWFIMRVDWYVLSLVCLELRDQVECEEGSMESFRHLSFFTVGFIDLYQSDDDLNDILCLDDTSAAGSVNFGESEIAREIELAHAANFARACYLALRDALAPITSLQADEVEYVLSSCRFTEVLQAFVSVEDLSAHLNSHERTMTGTKLGAVIETLLRVVPGSYENIFFYHGPEIACLDEATNTNIPDGSHDDFMADDVQSFSVEQPLGENPPLFFRFTLDEKLVSFNEILALKKSAMLAAQVSVFVEPEKKLPQSHAAVVSKLQNALNSFASEQTLEKFRFLGRSLTEEDFKVVMQNIAKTNHHSLDMPLEFFISRSNSLVHADNPTGSNENDLDHGFSVLMEELDKATFTVRASQETFLVLDDSASRDVLPYWCFIQVRKPRGSVIVRVHHPLGEEAAEKQAKITQRLVKSILVRTNQLLLLDSLYTTKNASDLLIREEPTENIIEANLTATYACPVQYSTAIPLHRRCAPHQAILELETTILQNFIISNRRSRSVFVYKDESSSVFYMTLNWFKIADDTEQNPHTIELLVHGCDKPGPLITDQLVSLLRRKLLTLTLDALSNLLKKNPFFNLLSSDLAFIKNFSNAIHALKEVDHGSTLPDRTRTYMLPPHVQDPLILLLMFRQNICGSTFIQQLHHESCSEESDSIQIDEDHGDIEKISFATLPDFQFYFNSSPSQLDPNYQPLVTLTGKGREYSRQAGSGIAIIEVNLQHGNDSECHIHVGKKADSFNTKVRVSKSDISLCTNEPAERHEQFKIKVEIINTTVDINVIHKWVHLSLSQVLVAWSIERLLESSRLCLLRNEQEGDDAGGGEGSYNSKLKSLNKTLPGLQALEDMISVASGMPHPAIASFRNIGTLKATVLANLTLELLESMMSLIACKRKIFEGINIIRYTGTDGAHLVNITKDSKSKICSRVQISGKGKVLKDRPVDSPEYTVVFGFGPKSFMDVSQHQFFTQVCVQSTQQETSAFSQALSRIQNENPSLFQRHLVFILRVSRSTRTLMTYNVNPQMKAKMELVFNDVEREVTKAVERSRGVLQSRCIRHISFLPNDSVLNEATTEKKPAKEEPIKKTAKEEPIVIDVAANRRPTRRIPRPTSMLRPKLIGKSVEGAAMQAVAANRLRASTRPAITQRTLPSTGKKKLTAAAPQREKIKDKAPPRERRAAGTQKKKREPTKVAASIVRSCIPHASLIKTYRALISFLKDGSESFTLQSRLNQSAMQNFAHTFLLSSKEKGSTLICSRLLSMCYGNFLGYGSIQPLQCDGEMSSAKLFIDHLTKCWGVKKIAPVSGTNDQNRSHLPQFLYLKKELLSSSSRRAIILMEISMPWDSSLNSSIFCYKTWLINSTDKTKVDTFSRKPFASLGSIEQEATFIETVALDFLGHLNLEQELFHFACLRVTRMARGARLDEKNPSTLCLLKSVISRYCTETQARLPLPGYRLQRRFLSLSTFLEGALLDGCAKETLVEHLSHHATLTCIGSADDTCFAGKINVEGFLVYYIISWHESVESALDVFVLCMTKGKCVDAYITKEGSRYAERISDVVIYSAMTTTQEIITNAAMAIRKRHLWQIFGDDYSPPLALGANLMGCITELRTFSYQLDLLLVDPRLETLLYDELNELQLLWRDVLNAITRSSSFAHSITYEESEASNYLVFYNEEDMFLDFVLDQRGRLREAKILVREQFTYHEYSNATESVTVTRAVQKFTMFLLQWMWSDCEI